MAQTPPDRRVQSQWRQASLAMALPMLMVSGPIVGFLLGLGLEKWLDLQPPWGGIARVVGVFLGIAAGLRETIRIIKRISSGS